MGRQARFRSRCREASDSKGSNGAYSEDKVRYFFMDDARPHQSDFLKTLIEKSSRKNRSALRNIYESINKRQARASRRKSSRRRRQPKFIELGEDTGSKETPNPEAPAPRARPQHSIANHELLDQPKALRASAQSGTKPRARKTEAEAKTPFPLTTKTKEAKEGINLGYYFSSQFMRARPNRHSTAKNPKSLHSANFTENFFDPRQPRPKKAQTRLNTSNDRGLQSHLKNFSQGKAGRSKQKRARAAQEPGLLTPSNLLFTHTQRTASIEKSKKKHFLLSSFSRNKSGRKPHARTELPPEKPRQSVKTPTNYMSVNYSKPLDNLYLLAGSSGKAQQIKSTLTPLHRKEKKYELKLFSEKKKHGSEPRRESPAGAEAGGGTKERKREREQEAGSKREPGKATSRQQEKERERRKEREKAKKTQLCIQTGELGSHVTVDQNLSKPPKRELREAGVEDCLATQKQNGDEKQKAAKIAEFLELLRAKCGLRGKAPPETREVRERLAASFRNWKATSLAEFFEFKSSKSLYKIKVS